MSTPTPATALPQEPLPDGTVRVAISRSRPSFRCKCGRELGPNEGRTIFRRASNPRAPGRGQNVTVFTCPDPACATGYVVESAERLVVAEPPAGEARNAPCPCGSGRKAKKCHPAGFVPAP